jgi:hypothetical protein
MKYKKGGNIWLENLGKAFFGENIRNKVKEYNEKNGGKKMKKRKLSPKQKAWKMKIKGVYKQLKMRNPRATFKNALMLAKRI